MIRTPSLVAAALFAGVAICGCAGMQAANRCNADLGTTWANNACMSAVQDPTNQELVKALGDKACARARLGIADQSLATSACAEARAKAKKAAWFAIEKAATDGSQPDLALDDLVPGLPAVPAPAASLSATSPAAAPSSAVAPTVGERSTLVIKPASKLTPTPNIPAPAPSAIPAIEIIPAGQWAIIEPNGTVLGSKFDSNGNAEPVGFATLQECQSIARGAARSALKDAVGDMANGLGPGSAAGDLDYSTWQSLRSTGCARSDGSSAFKIYRVPR